MAKIEELRKRIERIEKRLDKIDENIDILMNPFQGKSSDIFKNLDIKNIAKAVLNPDAGVNLRKTDIEKLKSSNLGSLEKQILLLLYKSEAEKKQGLTIPQLAERLNCLPQLISETINSLTKKGVSFVSKKIHNFYVFRLDETLKEFQAKENFL